MHPLSKNNKTLILSLIFISGCAFSLASLQIVAGIILIATASFCISRKIISFRFLIICAVTLAISMIYTNVKTPTADILYKFAPVEAELTGCIDTPPKVSDYSQKFEMSVKTAKIKETAYKSSARTLVTTDKFTKFKQGQTIKLKVHLKRPYPASNPGQFDYAEYLKTKKIFTISSLKHSRNAKLLPPEGIYNKLIYKLDGIKTTIFSYHSQFLPHPYSEILSGVVFGDYAVSVPKSVKDNFINSGLLHLLAASGMNVGIIYLFWMFMAKNLFIPPKVAVISGAGIVLIYALLTGMPPSVTRALIMLEFIIIGKLLDKEADNLALLSIACTLMVLYNPLILKDIGFQMSFLVTFGLLFMTKDLIDTVKFIPAIVAGHVVVPVVAQLWASPIQLLNFNTFALYSVPANIFAVVPVEIVSFLGFAGSIFSLIPIIGKYACLVCDKICLPFIWIMLKVAETASSQTTSLLYFAKPNMLSIVVFYAGLLSFAISLKLKFLNKLANLSFIIFAITLCCTFTVKPHSLTITYLSLGKGNTSTIIHTPQNKTYIINTGDSCKGNLCAAKYVILPYLKSKNITAVDGIIITEPKKQRYGGLPKLLKSIKIKNIYAVSSLKEDKKFLKILKKYKEDFIPIYDKKNIQISNGAALNIRNTADKLDLNLRYYDFTADFKEKKSILRTSQKNETLTVYEDKIANPYTGNCQNDTLTAYESAVEIATDGKTYSAKNFEN